MFDDFVAPVRALRARRAPRGRCCGASATAARADAREVAQTPLEHQDWRSRSTSPRASGSSPSFSAGGSGFLP